MPTISELVVKITGDTKGLTSSLTDTQAKMGKFAIGAAAAAAAVVAVTKAVAKATQEFIDYGGAIDDAAQRTGMSTDAVQEWKYVAEQTGTTVDSITGALTVMTKRLESNATEFENLGIATRNADGSFRSTNDIFNDTIAALSGMTDIAERDQLAFKLLGNGASQLVPILNEGSDGLASLKKEAHDLGIVLSEDTIKRSAELGDSMDRLKAAMTSARNNMVDVLAPAITAVTNFLADQIEKTIAAKRSWEELERAKKGETQTEDEIALAIQAQTSEIDRLNNALAYRSQLDAATVASLEKQLADGQKLLKLLEDQRAAQARYAAADARGAAEKARLKKLADEAEAAAKKAAEEAAKREAARIELEKKAIAAAEARIAAEVRLKEIVSAGRQELFEQMEEYEAAQVVITRETTTKQLNEFDRLKKGTKNTYKEIEKFSEEAYKAIGEAVNSLADLVNAVAVNQERAVDKETQRRLKAQGLLEKTTIERLKEERDAALAAGDTVTAAEKEQELERERIVLDGERKKADIRYNADMASWVSTLALATADAARAIVRSFSDLGPIGGAIAAVAIGATSAFQLAAISAAKPVKAAFAMGTDFAPGGRALVGENGPEIVNIPKGASVTPAHRTMSGGHDSGVTVNIHSPVALNPSEAAAVFKQTARELAFVGAL